MRHVGRGYLSLTKMLAMSVPAESRKVITVLALTLMAMLFPVSMGGIGTAVLLQDTRQESTDHGEKFKSH